MSLGPGQEALALDQAPPLSIPASFFLLAPLALVAAGALLLAHGAAALATAWAPATLALTHLGTLGLLGAVMLGALLQMLPVVGGAPVPAVRAAHLAHPLLAFGVGAFAWGFAQGRPAWLPWAGASLTAALGLLLPLLAVALWRAPTRGPTVYGMRLAVASLALLATLGLLMARGFWGGPFPGPRPAWLQVHATVALIGWVGALLTAVSLQVLPMFTLCPPLEPARARWPLAAVGAGVALPTLALATAPSAGALVALALPGALVVWGLHPLWALHALRRRRRPRPDPNVRAWQLGMAAALLAWPLLAGALWGSSPRWTVALGWTLILGWAGLVVHGMLTRIVPFLVWWHRLSPWVGLVDTPPMRRLLPERAVRAALAVHVGALGLGLVAIATGSDALARLAGAAVLALGVALGAELGWTLSWRTPKAPSAAL